MILASSRCCTRTPHWNHALHGNVSCKISEISGVFPDFFESNCYFFTFSCACCDLSSHFPATQSADWALLLVTSSALSSAVRVQHSTACLRGVVIPEFVSEDWSLAERCCASCVTWCCQLLVSRSGECNRCQFYASAASCCSLCDVVWGGEERVVL